MDNKPELEALKQAYEEAKAVQREAAKMVLDFKRLADAARRRATEAFGAYNAARRPTAKPRPRPARAEELDPDWPFASEEVA
ncbi:MAG: hypothetical protein AAFZ65_17780 [Planctomycetota bacterium]